MFSEPSIKVIGNMIFLLFGDRNFFSGKRGITPDFVIPPDKEVTGGERPLTKIIGALKGFLKEFSARPAPRGLISGSRSLF